VNSKGVTSLVIGLNQNTQYAVSLAAWFFANALSYFSLKHSGEFNHSIAVFKHLKNNLSRNVIWKVSGNGQGLTLEDFVKV